MRRLLRLPGARGVQLARTPELWRRFTITLRRTLARRAGLSAAEFGGRCRLSYVKVAEYQRRAVVQFHALIRLDAPGDDYTEPRVPLDVGDLAVAIREAAGAVRLTVVLPSARGSTPAAALEGHQCPDRERRAATAEQRMWAHYQRERGAGRTPTGAELGRIAGTNNYGRAVIAGWRRTGRIPATAS